MKGVLEDSLVTLNYLDNYKLEENDGTLTLVFDRESDDNLLGKTVAELDKKGAKILDVETEKATLLDVLESYE